MASTKDRVEHLGASVGLTDEELIEMYFGLALARAVDERMWILNRAGRIPSSSAVRARGRPGGDGLADAQATRLGRAVLPLDRDVSHVRDERPRHPDRPVRHRFGSVVGRAPDARPLWLARAQPGVGVVAGGDASLHAVGIALAAKIRRTDQVAMAIMGEGSSNQGDVHQFLNFAQIHKLAVRVRRREPPPLQDQRADGGRWPGPASGSAPLATASLAVVDGADVLACYHAAKVAVDRARAETAQR